jgi:hypothetical protein
MRRALQLLLPDASIRKVDAPAMKFRLDHVEDKFEGRNPERDRLNDRAPGEQ